MDSCVGFDLFKQKVLGNSPCVRCGRKIPKGTKCVKVYCSAITGYTNYRSLCGRCVKTLSKFMVKAAKFLNKKKK